MREDVVTMESEVLNNENLEIEIVELEDVTLLPETAASSGSSSCSISTSGSSSCSTCA